MNIQEDNEEIQERTSMQMECIEERSESGGYTWKATDFFTNSWRMKRACTVSWKIKISLESCLEKRAQEMWEKDLRKTTLLNMCNPMLMEKIFKVFLERFEEDDRMNIAVEIAGLIPKTSLECKKIEKMR